MLTHKRRLLQGKAPQEDRLLHRSPKFQLLLSSLASRQLLLMEPLPRPSPLQLRQPLLRLPAQQKRPPRLIGVLPMELLLK